MSQTLSPSSARCYGLARVARVWTVSRASVYRSLKETPPNTIARRPGPVGACSDGELADHIRRQIAASRLHGEGYRKLWARLRFAGVRASPRRVRRVMGENGLLAPHRVGRAESKPHDNPHRGATFLTRSRTRCIFRLILPAVPPFACRPYPRWQLTPSFVRPEHAQACLMNVPSFNSANARCSSAWVFITIGP